MDVRILVVDDDADQVAFLTELLTKAGYRVDGLTDPTAALPVLLEGEHHLLVVDQMMPAMNGTELLARVREHDDDIAAIVCTGNPTIESAVESLRSSASDYLRKPVEPAAFLATVKRVLAGKGISGDPEGELLQRIGRTIRETRQAKKLTLKQLGRRAGLSTSLLSQIERAESSASIGSLWRISRALGLPVGDLFGQS